MMEIISIKDLRNTTEISELCIEKQEPIFVTENGYCYLVIMSMETYDRLLLTKDFDESIYISESEIKASGELKEAKNPLDDLRKKHLG